MKQERFEYDVQKRARAGTAATLRAAVSVYLIYLGWTVIRGIRNGDSPVPIWVGGLAALVFAVAAIGFGVYAWKIYRRDLEAARLPERAVEENPDVPDEEDNACE